MYWVTTGQYWRIHREYSDNTRIAFSLKKLIPPSSQLRILIPARSNRPFGCHLAPNPQTNPRPSTLNPKLYIYTELYNHICIYVYILYELLSKLLVSPSVSPYSSPLYNPPYNTLSRSLDYSSYIYIHMYYKHWKMARGKGMVSLTLPATSPSLSRRHLQAWSLDLPRKSTVP